MRLPWIGGLIAALLASTTSARQTVLPNDRHDQCEFVLMRDLPGPVNSVIRWDNALAEVAEQQNLLILIFEPNPHSHQYIGKSGYRAKGRELVNCKSLWSGKRRGLVSCHPQFFRDTNHWQHYVQELSRKGFKVLGPEEDYVVLDAAGRAHYSDVDLLGVYDADSGTSRYSYDWRMDVNNRIGAKVLRHGPLDEYELRFSIGLKFPVTIYLPDGRIGWAENRAQLRKIYDAYHIPFVNIWGDS